MFGTKGLYVSASGTIQGRHGCLVSLLDDKIVDLKLHVFADDKIEEGWHNITELMWKTAINKIQ